MKKLRFRLRASTINNLRDWPTAPAWIDSKLDRVQTRPLFFQCGNLNHLLKRKACLQALCLSCRSHSGLHFKGNLWWFNFWSSAHSSTCQVDTSPTSIIKAKPILMRWFLHCKHLYIWFCLSCRLAERDSPIGTVSPPVFNYRGPEMNESPCWMDTKARVTKGRLPERLALDQISLRPSWKESHKAWSAAWGLPASALS